MLSVRVLSDSLPLKTPPKHPTLLDKLGHTLHFPTYPHWYTLIQPTFLRLNGGPLLKQHHQSLFNLLTTSYQSFHWVPWHFSSTPQHFWQRQEHHVQYLHWFSSVCHFVMLSDWYGVKHEDFLQRQGTGLLNAYVQSMFLLLHENIPGFCFKPWKFCSSPKGFWSCLGRQREVMSEIGLVYQFEKFEDFYGLSLNQLLENARGLCDQYDSSSLGVILKKVYPEYWFLPWKLKFVPGKFWEEDEGSLRVLVDCVERELKIEEKEDWYRVSWNQAVNFSGVRGALEEFGGLSGLLRKVYPLENWEDHKFNRGYGKQSEQRWLLQNIKELFPNEVILENYKHPLLVYSKTMKKMELDIFLPSLKIAFEYQGQQHYQDSFFGSGEKRSLMDKEKMETATRSGITLIEVPYWWNKSKVQLTQLIQKGAPLLLNLNVQ